MTTFSLAVATQRTTTENGCGAFVTTGNHSLDLFADVGVCAPDKAKQLFASAYAEDPARAIRIMQFARDIRGGSGKRDVYHTMLDYLAVVNFEAAKDIVIRTPEIGSWKDLLKITNSELKKFAFDYLFQAIKAKDALAAKWAPTENAYSKVTKSVYKEFLAHTKLTPRAYRKLLGSARRNIVETLMSAKKWDEINYSGVPSIAADRYKKAFKKNDEGRYVEYVSNLSKGVDKEGNEVKINSSVLYPHTIVKALISTNGFRDNHFGLVTDKTFVDVALAQWKGLPNYLSGNSILAMVDTSLSMESISGSTGVMCRDIALSIGLYIAEKNTGPFKDLIMTFSRCPQLQELPGNIYEKLSAIKVINSTTDVERALILIAETGRAANVSNEDMPKTLLILSDMQFNQAVVSTSENPTATDMVKQAFRACEYDIPNVVYWNLNAKYDNKPITAKDSGVCVISGYSPSVLEGTLKAVENGEFNPIGVMDSVIMKPRYDISVPIYSGFKLSGQFAKYNITKE